MPPGGGGDSCLGSPAPSSLFTSKPQEHEHAGLPKPHSPNTIEDSYIQLRGGGIYSKYHSRGHVQLLAAVPNLLPTAHFGPHSDTSPHLFRSRPGRNNETPYPTHSIDRVEMYV